MTPRKQILFSAAALAFSGLSCDTGGPSFDAPFPFLYLQDIGVAGEPAACDFMSSSGTAVVAAGTHMYFIDHDMGYVLADIDAGYPLTDLCATAEGGYAAAVYGNLLIYVSDGTYLEHEPVLLPAYGLYVAAQPSGNALWVACSDGSIQTVSTLTWDVSSSHATSVGSPSGIAANTDGSRIFVADASDSTVKTLSTADFSLLAEEDIPGGAADLCSAPQGGAWVACSSGDAPHELWHLDAGTGLHDGTIPLPGDAISVAVTPDNAWFFAGLELQTVVVDGAGTVEASDNGNEAPAVDIAISGDGDRAVVCQGAGSYRVWMLQKP
jgi:DNA-binding beta-propeller fold protein YncE